MARDDGEHQGPEEQGLDAPHRPWPFRVYAQIQSVGVRLEWLPSVGWPHARRRCYIDRLEYSPGGVASATRSKSLGRQIRRLNDGNALANVR
jgi:hypothetical protein